MTSKLTLIADKGNTHAFKIDTPAGPSIHLQPGESRELYLHGDHTALVREGAAHITTGEVVDVSETVVLGDKAVVISPETIAEVREQSEINAREDDAHAFEAVTGDHNLPPGSIAADGAPPAFTDAREAANEA